MKQAAPLMHGSDWSGENLTGWVAQEKFDGVRAVLTCDGRLFTREGHELTPPAGWLQGLTPDYPIDAELYAGPGKRVSHLANVHRWSPESPRWESCWLVAFDVILFSGYGFEERFEILRGLVGTGCHKIAEVWTIGSLAQLARDLQRIQKRGGEGIMARAPEGDYRPGRSGRSEKLLKVKRLI